MEKIYTTLMNVENELQDINNDLGTVDLQDERVRENIADVVAKVEHLIVLLNRILDYVFDRTKRD